MEKLMMVASSSSTCGTSLMSSCIVTEADIFETKEDVLISPTGGIPCKKIARFLKPIVSSPQDSKFKQPFIHKKSRWPLDVAFNGWNKPLKNWNLWVEEMLQNHYDLWKKAGILEAILGSKYKFRRVKELLLGIAERWNCDTNTIVFPWGEATITLEDMLILGGFSVLGAPVFQPIQDADLCKICKELSNTVIKKKIGTHLQWLDYFRNKKGKYEHEAFLSLWLSMFVFPGETECDDTIFNFDKVIPIAVSLANGNKFALAPAVLATIYRDMSLLKASLDASSIMEYQDGGGHVLAVTLWAPLYLVQIWAWERFIQFRPEPNPLNKDEPRVARWHDLSRLDIGNVRPIIASSGDLFLWRPYCLCVNNWPFPMFYKEKKEWISVGLGDNELELESFIKCLRVCFLVGVDCGEPYYPNRVAMQFGFDQDIPRWIPRSKYCPEVAWLDYSRPFGITARLELPHRLVESDVSTRYLDWWRKDVLLLPVESFQGLVRKRRSSRIKHAPNAKRQKMEKTCAGFLPNENIMLGRTQTSNSRPEIGRMESFVQIADVTEFNVPSGSLPKAAAEFDVPSCSLPNAAAELVVPTDVVPNATAELDVVHIDVVPNAVAELDVVRTDVVLNVATELDVVSTDVVPNVASEPYVRIEEEQRRIDLIRNTVNSKVRPSSQIRQQLFPNACDADEVELTPESIIKMGERLRDLETVLIQYLSGRICIQNNRVLRK